MFDQGVKVKCFLCSGLVVRACTLIFPPQDLWVGMIFSLHDKVLQSPPGGGWSSECKWLRSAHHLAHKHLGLDPVDHTQT